MLVKDNLEEHLEEQMKIFVRRSLMFLFFLSLVLCCNINVYGEAIEGDGISDNNNQTIDQETEVPKDEGEGSIHLHDSYEGDFIKEDENCCEDNTDYKDSLLANENTKDVGWIETEQGKQYIDSKGEFSYGFCNIEGQYYYFDSSGFLQYGFVEIEGIWYYADEESGRIKTSAGFVEWNGEKYYVIAGGAVARGQQVNTGNGAYYFDDECRLVKGIYRNNMNGIWYYADEESGRIKTSAGFVEWNGGRYYVKQGGALYRNQFIHSVDANGLKKYYYVGNDGKVFIGEFTIDGVTYTTSEDGVINENVVLQGTKGIDVSEWNGTIDWAKVKAAGIDFAFIRVGGRYYGSGGMYGDSTFVKNIRNAIAAGIKVGVYYFTQAINTEEAIEEAVYTINQIRGYGLSLPVVIDTEATPDGRHNNISVATRTNVIKAFCDKIQSSGYTPMIYGSTSWLNDKLNMNELSNYLVWVAQYYYKCEYEGEYQCWQYTSSGRVNGVNGNVDMNYWYGANDSLIVE